MLLCHALCIPDATEPSAAIDAAIAELESLAALSSPVVPPQSAYHALLRACSQASLPEHSRKLFEQLQQAGRRPDAQTIGWLSHALIESSCHSPPLTPTTSLNSVLLVDEEEADDAEGILSNGARESGRQAATACAAAATTSEAAPRRNLSFTTGAFTPATDATSDRARHATERQADEARIATLDVGNVCSGCGAALAALDAVRGWLERSEIDGLGYCCECPRCKEPWQPLLRIRMRRLPPGALGGEGKGEGDGVGERARAGEVEPEKKDLAGEVLLECPLLSPPLLLREIESLVESSRDRSTLRDGWMSARHLFPSLFWSLCWHAAPIGLLQRLLADFELTPLQTIALEAEGEDRAESSALILLHSCATSTVVPAPFERHLRQEGQQNAPPIPAPTPAPAASESISAESDAASAADTTTGAPPPPDFGEWVAASGHFVLPLPPLTHTEDVRI